jgi:membrane-associated phospholipid phosphatase
MIELLYVIMFYFLYKYAKNKDAKKVALLHSNQIVNLEKILKINYEHNIQLNIIKYKSLKLFFSLWYLLMHNPFSIMIMIYIYFNFNYRYYLIRDSFCVMNFIGILIYKIWPLTPPRLNKNFLLRDICDELNLSKIENAKFQNPHAAMPSMHAAYSLFFGVVLSYLLKSFLPLLLPCVMFLTIIVTGHHYILDAVVGYVIAFISLFIIWINL